MSKNKLRIYLDLLLTFSRRIDLNDINLIFLRKNFLFFCEMVITTTLFLFLAKKFEIKKKVFFDSAYIDMRHKQYNFAFHFYDNNDIYNTYKSINEGYKYLI